MYESDYRPTIDDMTSSDNSEIIPVTPNIARFKTHSPIKKNHQLKQEKISQQSQTQLQPTSSAKRKPIKKQSMRIGGYTTIFLHVLCKTLNKTLKHLLNLYKSTEDI